MAEAMANYDEEVMKAGREGWNRLDQEEKERCIERGKTWWTGLEDFEQHGFVEAR